MGPLAIALFDTYRKDLINLKGIKERLDGSDDEFADSE